MCVCVHAPTHTLTHCRHSTKKQPKKWMCIKLYKPKKYMYFVINTVFASVKGHALLTLWQCACKICNSTEWTLGFAGWQSCENFNCETSFSWLFTLRKCFSFYCWYHSDGAFKVWTWSLHKTKIWMMMIDNCFLGLGLWEERQFGISWYHFFIVVVFCILVDFVF